MEHTNMATQHKWDSNNNNNNNTTSWFTFVILGLLWSPDKYNNRSTRRFNLNWLQLLLNAITWRSTVYPETKRLTPIWKSTPAQIWVGLLSQTWTRLLCLQKKKKNYMCVQLERALHLASLLAYF